MKPTVSINLCCYNSEKYLRETLDSIVSQTYKDWELVIINDGSSDSTESIIFKYKNQGYPIIYHYQENRGLGASRNEALKLSQGEYIAFIDHDDIWLPQKLEKQIPLFADTSVGLVYSDAIYFVSGTRYAYRLYKTSPLPSRGNIFGNLLVNCGLNLSTVAIRREILNDIPWFPEDMEISEDFDLFMRILYCWKADYIEEPLTKYRLHDLNLSLKRPDLIAHEIQRLIERLNDFFPDIHDLYGKEISYFSDIRYRMWKAEALWYKNDKKGARQELLSLLRKRLNLRAFLSFILTFFYTFEEFRSIIEKLKYLKVIILKRI